MSKVGRIILTLLAGLMFGFLTWKLFPFSMIKLNPCGFVLMLVGIGLFCFSTWKVSAKNQYSFLDNIALWLLIVLLVILFPGFLISMRIAWFFNTIPGFGLLFLTSGMGLIFCVSLIHKLLSRFFTNGLWVLDIIHLSAPFWMPAIAPLTISIGADLTLPNLFTWTGTYVYYAVVICFIIVGLFIHKKRGNPSPLLIGRKFYPFERISLKVTLTLLMGLFVFISTALMMKYSAEIGNLIHSQSIGLTVVGGYDFRIRMAKYLFLLCNACSIGAVIMIIWMWFVKEMMTAHTQVSLIFLPLFGVSVVIQMVLYMMKKFMGLLFFLNMPQYMPLLQNEKYPYYFLYVLYGMIIVLGYILVRGLLLPKTDVKQEDIVEE